MGKTKSLSRHVAQPPSAVRTRSPSAVPHVELEIRFCTSKRISKSAAGFTVIELLVVLGIIGVLIGLLIPGVLAARTAAKRAECGNNLRQIGIGLQNYHNVNNVFPPGGLEPISRKWPKGRQIAWSALLLPYIEQELVHKMIDFKKAYNSPENAEAAATVVSTYLCPSVSRDSLLIDGRAAIDYGGIYGERITSPNNPPKGAMIYDKPMNVRDIRDGTSTTLIVAECGGFHDGQWINALNIFDQAYAINQAPEFENDISSQHAGGANAVFCDGHVKFLNEEMDMDVLAAICTRAGGEMVTEVK
jgi:prepilin-type processing-associated H-X9-DG protein/prepilin-type N-terminal cleavage/methylation domain-containing protein